MQTDLEQKLKYIESLFEKYHAEPVAVRNEEKLGLRTTFRCGENYYRIDTEEIDGEVCIIINAIDDSRYAQVGLMEEISAFPAKLTEEEMEKEIRFLLD